MKKEAVLYIHGKGGSAAECEHYRPLFPGCGVFGSRYRGSTPWEAGREIRAEVEKLKGEYGGIILIANSVGAFYVMNAGIDAMIKKAYFISPIVGVEKLILGMMKAEGVTEDELRSKGVILSADGEELSWEYLCFVREHPIEWNAPTHILYAGKDFMTDPETVRAFAEKHKASLTVMEGGEHWFHTDEQMRFLDGWIRDKEGEQ